MSNTESYRELIEQAVQLALERSVFEPEEPSIAAIEPAATAIGETLDSTDETGKRDFEFTFHTLASDLTQQLVKTPEDTETLSKIKALLDTAILVCNDGILEPAFVFALTDEVMESVSIDIARDIFDFLEVRAALVRKVMAKTPGKGVQVLKICNSLLRRIPQATMNEFAGRVQVFIANSFALSERSGVNVRGDFNTANLPITDSTGLEEGSREEKLYQSFWSLQESFVNPRSVFKDRPESFNNFIRAAKVTLEEFQKADHNRQSQAAIAAAMHDTVSLKYLTSPRLLAMQFSDPHFRGQILVQLLIFARYALSMAGKNFEKLKKTAKNKMVMVNMEITDAEEQTLELLSTRVANQLLTTVPDRGVFRKSTLFMLMHEEDWAKWKAGGCRPFEGAPIPQLLDEMQAAALSFFGVREAQYRESGAPMGSAKIADVWATDFAALDGIGYDAQSVTLKDKLGELDRFCRSDRDYDFLTQKEQQAVDLLRWQSLRMSIPTGDIRDADPTSMSLETTRENVLGVKEDQASTTDVDDEPLVTEV